MLSATEKHLFPLVDFPSKPERIPQRRCSLVRRQTVGKRGHRPKPPLSDSLWCGLSILFWGNSMDGLRKDCSCVAVHAQHNASLRKQRGCSETLTYSWRWEAFRSVALLEANSRHKKIQR